MNAQTQNILKWVLGIGMALAGVKVVIDLTKPAPAPVTTDAWKPAPSASASEEPLLLGVPKPHASGGLPMPTATGSAAANPLGPLQAKLAAIAKDPEGNKPAQRMKDPQGETLVYLYELPGLKQPVLITFVGKPEMWQWKFGSSVPPSMFSENGEMEDLKAPEEGVHAQKIVAGPLAGAVVMTVDEQPALRIIHSPALWAQAMAEMAGAAPSASGSASGGKPGKPAPSSSGRTPK